MPFAFDVRPYLAPGTVVPGEASLRAAGARLFPEAPLERLGATQARLVVEAAQVRGFRGEPITTGAQAYESLLYGFGPAFQRGLTLQDAVPTVEAVIRGDPGIQYNPNQVLPLVEMVRADRARQAQVAAAAPVGGLVGLALVAGAVLLLARGR
jgi:hypothetical protein